MKIFQKHQNEYEEREGKATTNKIDLMADFFTRNRAFSHRDYIHPDHPDSIFVSFDEGVGLGTKLDGSLMIVKTYVSNDMPYDDQANAQLECREVVEECYKKFAKGADYSIKAA